MRSLRRGRTAATHCPPESSAAPALPRRTATRRRDVDQAVASFTGNATRLRYGTFRALDLPVGSGVVEGLRAKRGWSERAAHPPQTPMAAHPAGLRPPPRPWSAPAPCCAITPLPPATTHTTALPANTRNYWLHPANPFERRFRDIYAVTQQTQARRQHLEAVGRVFLGFDTEVS